MKKNSYIAITFVILVFGIYAVPKIVKNFTGNQLLQFEKVPAFEFTDQNNKLVSNSNFEDKVYVVEFFFTSCPTICPRMNENMVKIQNAFLKDDDVMFLSISVTPEIDSISILKDYAIKKGVIDKKMLTLFL